MLIVIDSVSLLQNDNSDPVSYVMTADICLSSALIWITSFGRLAFGIWSPVFYCTVVVQAPAFPGELNLSCVQFSCCLMLTVSLILGIWIFLEYWCLQLL